MIETSFDQLLTLGEDDMSKGMSYYFILSKDGEVYASLRADLLPQFMTVHFRFDKLTPASVREARKDVTDALMPLIDEFEYRHVIIPTPYRKLIDILVPNKCVRDIGQIEGFEYPLYEVEV